jgi:uncharacterized membrane protein YeiH
MQRLFAVLLGTLGSYLRDVLREAVTMLWHASLFVALRLWGFSSFFLFDWWFPLLFCNNL